MCGIGGFVGNGNMPMLKKIINILSHRGPDNHGYWIDTMSNAGLAMTRLSVIDPESGSQPVFSEDQNIICVFNGEIYNFITLRNKLIKKGHTFNSNCDAEVIVHGYEEYCENVPEHLDGMFAFAIWDINNKKLFCARDRIGIKPFYYYHDGKTFYFASEQKAILAVLNRPMQIDHRSLFRHLIIGFYTGPYSMFDGIKQLPPASILILRENSVRIGKYWELPDNDAVDHMREKAAINMVCDKLADSVSSHLVSDTPLGVTLSGGLDSSIISYLMSQNNDLDTNGTNLQSYTIGYGVPSDENRFACLVNNKLGMLGHEKICSVSEAIDDIPAMVWHLEEPLSNITAITAYQWAKFISQDLKVTLIGDGADELFGGYIYHRLFSGIASFIPGTITRRLSRFAILQPPLSLIIKLFGSRKEVKEEVNSIFYDEYLGVFSSSKNKLRSILRYDMEHGLSNNQLLRIDRMTMAHSLEARVPYLDHHFIESVWKWSNTYKIKGNIQKYILRKAFKDVLPKKVVNRPKMAKGGSQPVFPIFFKTGLERIIIRALTNKNNPVVEMFDQKTLDELINFKKGNYPIFKSRVRDKLLYSLFLFVIWHGLYIERNINSRQDIPTIESMALS